MTLSYFVIPYIRIFNTNITDSNCNFITICDPLYSSKDEYYGLEYYEGNVEEMKMIMKILAKIFN
jgi:hypothetical protein